MLKSAEIRQMSDEEILDQIEDAKVELFDLRFDWSQSTLADASRINELKKDVARMKTILRERELGINGFEEQDSDE